LKIVLKIQNKDRLIGKLKQFAKDGEDATKTAILIKARETTAEAKRLAPVDMGELRQNITYEKQDSDGLHYSIIAFANYAAYVEFGTGKKVSVPDEFADMAIKFKDAPGGSFEDGLKRIQGWCKRHGIEESAAYPIFMSILNKGIEPQPFLHPAFKSAEETFKKDLEFVFNQLIEKYNK